MIAPSPEVNERLSVKNIGFGLKLMIGVIEAVQ